jgi:hypothetical protein
MSKKAGTFSPAERVIIMSVPPERQSGEVDEVTLARGRTGDTGALRRHCRTSERDVQADREALAPRPASGTLPTMEGKLNGAPIKTAIVWVRKTYGADLYARALDSCGAEIRGIFSAEVFAGTYYPIQAWDTVLDAIRREVKAKTGEDEATFDRRNIFEAGNQIVLSLYSFVLQFMDPRKVVTKLNALWTRLYPDCTVKIVTNELEHCVADIEGPAVYRKSATHHFAPGLDLLLTMSGAKDVQVRVVHNNEVDGRFSLRAEGKYKK